MLVNKMHIVTSHPTINSVWLTILKSKYNCMLQCSTLYDVISLSYKDILNIDLWVIEAFIDDDPVGFRTALSLAGSNKILLVINPPISSYVNSEGDYWITYSFRGNLVEKIQRILTETPRLKKDYENLIEICPALGQPPKNTHR